jgi:glycosyltransferase involved in cell wall biosynthesis
MTISSPHKDARSKAFAAREKIRVAWLFPSLARAYYWQPVFKEFAALCPRTAVFTSIWPGFAPEYEGAFEVHTLPGLRYIELKKQVLDSRRGFIWTPLSILNKLAAFGPDVVFSSGFSGWTLCGLLFKLLRRSKVIIYWEGCSAQSVGKSKAKLLGRRWIARFADAAVSNGEEGIDYLRDAIGMPQEKLLCHPCQVPDMSLLDSGKATLPALQGPVFLYVGSITARKGWRYLLDATALLVDRGIRNFSVLFIGTGDQEAEMRDAVRDRQLQGIVHLSGAVAYQNLGSCYRAADVFVSPTRADTWGVAVLEAMAFGKPVLCSKYAGSRQMVTHGKNGFIFDPFDTEQLAAYMAKFIDEHKLISQFGERSRERIAPFTCTRAAEVLASLALRVDAGAKNIAGLSSNIVAPSRFGALS